MEIVSKSLKDTKEFAREILSEIQKDESKALVFCLSGNLGSGKTAFVKTVGELLGIKEMITSPTFVLMKRYSLLKDANTEIKEINNNFSNIIHIDAYRLKDESDFTALNWNEIIGNRENIVFIEWPEIVKGILPDNAVLIEFEFVNEETRRIKYKGF